MSDALNTKAEAAPRAPLGDETAFAFTATATQRRYWLLDQLHDGGHAALRMVLRVRWHGPVDLQLLRGSLNAVVARHEALRTTFAADGERLQQLVAPTLSLDFSFIETANVDESVARLIQQPFNLETGPLLRACLLRIRPNEQQLVFIVHHIVFDGWSADIFRHDFCAFYTAMSEGRSAELPQLQFQFADYAEWQQARIDTDDFAVERRYWRERLARDFTALDFPIEGPHRREAAAAGATVSRSLPSSLAAAARKFATAEGATPFMFYLAAFEALLHRYTGATEFLITSPNANRVRREFEALIGPFVNPLLLSADVRGMPSFRELLRRVRSDATSALVHAEIPFDLLLDQFQAPQLQVNFHYASAPQLTDGIAAEAEPIGSAGSLYELSASVLEERTGTRVEFEYNRESLAAEFVEQMIEHYLAFLECALAEPNRSINALPIVRAEETRCDAVNVDAPPLAVRSILSERVMARTDIMLARHGRRELSYAELLARLELDPVQSDSEPSALDRVAAWIAHWRARTDAPMPAISCQTPSIHRAVAAAGRSLAEIAEFRTGERVASCSPAGLAATEEIAGALHSDVLLVYPTPGLLAESSAALAAWLNSENISVAFLPAATWNRLCNFLAARKTRKPAKLRLVIATQGDADEGSFGRISAPTFENIRVIERIVIDAAGGTVALDDRMLSQTMELRIVDPYSGQLVPKGVVGELVVAVDNEAKSTGELARWRKNGAIERLGSIGAQRYVGGSRADPRRLETALGSVAGIRHAAVIGDAGESTAYLLADGGARSVPNEAAFRQSLRHHGVPEFAFPTTFVRVKDVPIRDGDGQLDVSALSNAPRLAPTTPAEPVRPYTGLQLQLIAIWEDVLGVSDIGIRDDFFELGGNSLLAMRMLQRAEAACGKLMSASALFHEATIEYIADQLAHEVQKESSPLLRVNESGSRAPMFFLHGDLLGGGFYTLKLSRALGSDQPFYVIPPQDVRALPAAPSIQQMAAAHLEALHAVRPRGPYVIGGFCLGGLIAFEVAQQLRASGEKVEMLLVIDAQPEDLVLRRLRALVRSAGTVMRWGDSEQVRRFGRLAVWRARLAAGVWKNVRSETRAAPRRIRHRTAAIMQLVRRARDKDGAEAESAQPALEPHLPSVFQWAAAGYRARPYDAPIAVLLSQDVIDGTNAVARAWQQLAPDVRVHALPGSHLECVTKHADSLATAIQSCLNGDLVDASIA